MPSARVRFDWLAFFLILSLSLPGMARVPSSQLKVTASSQEEEFAAAKAIDGDPSSRWSSHFTDGEWLQVDLGQPTEIAGARILWESAYGKDYDLAISDDGQNWTTVATVRDSDGGEDEVYFAPHSARFLKLIGVKRGTGWGYSIFEFEPLQLADVPTASAEGTTDGAPAAVIDGGAATWTGTGALTLQFPEARDVGGLRIQWGDPHPSEFSISVSADGATWTRAQAISGAGGGTNLVYFTHAQAKALKVDWPPGQPAQIREVEIKSGEEGWNPSRHYESLQTILPTGSLPRWLRRQQTFWTIVGVGSDTEETLIGEEGTVEPYAGSFCVMPFVATGGRVWTSEQFTASHTLEKNFLPIPMVSLASDAVSLSVSAVSYGPAGESSSAVRYRLENPGKEPLKATLGLAVRPLQLNPPWQYGGFSAIKSAKINGQTLELNAKPAIHFLSEPSTIAVGDRNAGDAFAWLATGKLPAGKAAADADGIVSALARYDLEIPAGGTRDVVVVFPLHRTSKAPDFQAHPSTFFDRTRREIGAAWEARLTGWDISCPIPGLADVMRSNLAYMLLNRDKAAAQPGPRNYSKSWMRDGSVSTSTYLKFGFTKEAGEYLRWIGGLVGQDGFVPFLIDPKTDAPPEFTADWREYDSQGEYVYAVAQYFAFTGDKKFLQESYPAVKRSIAYLIQKLGERRVPKYEGTEFYGILPESNSHEGYFPAKHSYWDDFWALRGLSDALLLAEVLGKADDVAAWGAERERFQKDFKASLIKVIQKKGISYIPGCAEKGDPDATSTSIAFTACDAGPFLESDPDLSKALHAGYDTYYRTTFMPRNRPNWPAFTPYEARNVEALSVLGEPQRAVDLLTFLIGPAMRPKGWNLLPEVVHNDPRTGSYIGDMPHTWVGADLINSARSLFVREEGASLVLGEGFPPAWLEKPGEVARVKNLRTRFGTLSYVASVDDQGQVRFDISGSAKPPAGFRVLEKKGGGLKFLPAAPSSSPRGPRVPSPASR